MNDEPELNPSDLEDMDIDMDVSTEGEAFDVVEITLDKFLDTACVDKVFGEPVQHGDTTIIPCAEVLAGLGFGVGYGYGQGPAPKPEGEAEGNQANQSKGSGGGGGGGGRVLSRPVAVVVSSPEGVRVEPVVDVTKLGLAAMTVFGFMATMTARMMSRRRMMKYLRDQHRA